MTVTPTQRTTPLATAEELDWPSVDPDAGQGPIPSYSPEELAELVALVSPLRVERDGKWVVIPTDLPTLRAGRAEYVASLQWRADQQFRQTSAYKHLALAARGEAEERRQEKRDARAEADRREAAREKRLNQLLSVGLSPLQAAAEAAKVYPET